MKVYQENKESVNGSIQIINSTILHEKARHGLMELSIKLERDYQEGDLINLRFIFKLN